MYDYQVHFDGQDVAIWSLLADSPDVVITFGAAPTRGEIIPFAAKQIVRSGVAGVFLVAKARHWWQTPEMGEALAMMNDLALPYGRRIGFGSSMGGYGALLFAADLGCSQVVAMSAQTTLIECPMAEGWGSDVILRDDVADTLTVVPLLVFDPAFEIDTAHARWLAERKPIEEFHVPDSGHKCGHKLKELGRFDAFVHERVLSSPGQLSESGAAYSAAPERAAWP